MSLALSLDCESSQVYAKFVKKTANWAGEESWQILNGATVIYTSPSLSNYAIRTIETCLTASANSQYTLKMKDTAGDAWSDGAFLEIYGINNNLAFKVMMTAGREETMNLSLYAPINKNEEWKYNTNADGNWKDVNYSDAAWTAIVLGVTPQQSTGTQYFRKSFTGLANMAAVELGFFYQYGIVAYINGVEVYRDNMPEGDVSTGTMATGGYSIYDYRGVYRSADVTTSSSNVLAVELHFTQTGASMPIEFNAYLAFGAGISNENKCFVAPMDFTVTSTNINNNGNAISWTRNTNAATSSIPGKLTFISKRAIVPAISSFRIWPFTSHNKHPTSFMLEGANSATGTFLELYSTTTARHTASTWTQFNRAVPANRFSVYRVTLRAAQNTPIYLNEIQFLVCNRPVPTSFSYPEASYTLYRSFQSVNVVPSTYGFTSCTSNPPLPAGMTVNSASCIISGTPTELAQATYTITAGGAYPATATVTFSVVDCASSLYKIVRTYKSGPQNESFRVRDSSNDAVILEVNRGHSSPANTDAEYFMCTDKERFDVALYHTSNYWASGSYIYFYYAVSATDGEAEMILKARFDNNQGNEANYYMRRPSIAASANWFYKMGTVPANWYAEATSTSDWQTGSKGSFTGATNGVQLYRQNFNINSLAEVLGVVLSIRYKYGCVVYLNGHEAFRNGVTGEVSTASTSSNTYSAVKYRVITLPGKTVPTTEVPTPVEYIKQGSNTIAIAIVGPSSDTQSYFDAIVRLMPNQPESHIWEYSVSSSGVNGASNVFNMYYGSTAYSTSCSANEIVLTLEDDRREWISSVQIQNYYNLFQQSVTQFKIYGRNSGDWILLKDISGLVYSQAGQKKRIYLNNNTPYNQFKFENFGTGNPSACPWKVQSLFLYADNTMVEPADLVYPASESAYKDIEMAEIIPEGADKYVSYTITPALPAGIHLDEHTGWIAGTATAESPVTSYQITATKLSGGTVTKTMSFSVQVCTGGKSLMTFRYRADSYANENSWKLFAGRGTSGTLLQSVAKFPVASAHYYVDFCKEDGIYTLQSFDSFGDGWQTGTGYTMTVDMGEMELEIEELKNGSPKPLSVSTVFSTFFPFQVEYTDWKVLQTEAPEGWNGVNYDDSAWHTRKAAAIPTTTYTTTYIRKTFQLTSVNDYQVLNIRMKYTGGVVVYFNGNKVARFNLIDAFDASTESIEVHDAESFSKFHIILATAGVQEGTNVVAFEIHRPKGASSSEPVVFDATGVFGLNDCSAVVDTYSSLTSSLSDVNIAKVMDLDPYTTASLPNSIGTFIEWIVENLEGSKWNSFNILGSSTVNNWGFDINTTFDPEDPRSEPVTTEFKAQSVLDRTKPQLAVPVALAGFRKVRWEVTNAGSSSTSIGSVHVAYCKASGNVCPGIDNYPPVGEGQISPSTCPEGYRGYAYRTCSNGQLGEVKMDMCRMKIPENARYSRSRYQFVMNTQSQTDVPTCKNIVTRWYMDEGVVLPEGLTLNEKTGQISGIPTDTSDIFTFTVYAENDAGAASAIISISVRKGQCKAEGVFPVTDVDSLATYQCSMQGSYIGTQTRACVLGETDGVWQKASGFCMPVMAIVLLVLAVIIIVVVVLFLLMRTGKKAKAVGGVKSAKKSSKSATKGSSKAKNSKNVKV